MDDKQTVLDILKDLTGEDFSDNLDEDLYSSALRLISWPFKTCGESDAAALSTTVGFT